MNEALHSFAEHPKLKDTDSVFVVIMSHGKREFVLGVNHSEENPDEFPVDNIYKHLGSQECPALMNKPKIIIIQACRGGSYSPHWVWSYSLEFRVQVTFFFLGYYSNRRICYS